MAFFRNLITFILVAAASIGGYLLFSKGPCDSLITYRIGSFDQRFGVSKTDFLADVTEAEKIWETPFIKDGKSTRQFFKYDPNGEISINLIYDTRQSTVDTNKTLKTAVDQTVASADTIKQQFLTLKASYDSSNAEYQTLTDQFKARLSSYNSETEYWNSRGGAPADEFAKLQTERANLETLRSQANDKMIALNNLAKEVNAKVDLYNSLVNAANSDVSKINQTANKEFEQGQYVSDANGRRINIYEFDGKNKLVRLLAHELGHAIGLNHNGNEQSIMYYLNKGSGLVLTTDDISSLRSVCNL